MRFLQLDLRNYGPFVDAEPIGLDGGSRGLHLVLGPNEAGKSTALRAIRTLLFGFPKSTRDNHGRDYATLRLVATLQGEGGEEINYSRHKKDLKPLWKPDDSEPIPPDSLAPFLGGVDAEAFRDLFSMDHAELVEGGRMILTGGGRLGEMLFAAGSGLATVAEVRKALDEETDQLFRPRAQNPSINAAIEELRKLRHAIEDKRLKTEDWEKLDQEIARARSQLAEVEAERPRVDLEKRRLERLRKALPRIARRGAVARELEARRHVAVLSQGFAEARRAESNASDNASKQGRDAASALEGIARDLDELGPPDPILAEAEAVDRLQLGLGVFLNHARERPARLAKLASVEADLGPRLAALALGEATVDPARLRAIARGRGPIRELGEQLGQLKTSCRDAEAEVVRLAGSTPNEAGESPPADAPRLAEALGEVVARVVALGDLDAQLALARAEAAEADRQAALALRSLRSWSGSLEALEALAVPSSATIERFEAEFKAVEKAIDRLEGSQAQLEADRLKIEGELEGVRLGGSPPTEADLVDRRSGRDGSWRAVRRAWLEAEKIADPSTLAAGFEAEVRSADELADRLRLEADRVAARAQLEANHRALLAKGASSLEELARKRLARGEILDRWTATWGPLGIDPLTPLEMREWLLLGRSAAVQKGVEARKARAKADGLAGRIDDLRAELGRGLGRLRELPFDPLDPLAASLDRARAAIAHVGRAVELGEARSALARAEAALAAWEASWAIAVEPLGLGVDASSARADEALGEVDDLIQAGEARSALREAIDEGARQGSLFRSDVEALAARLGFEPPGEGPESALLAIRVRLDHAREAKASREAILGLQANEREKWAKAQAEVVRSGLALDALVNEARCESRDGLIAAEGASDEVKGLRKELRELDEWLVDTAEGDPLDALVREAARPESDPATLDARIGELADRLAPLEAERDRFNKEIGGLDEQVRRMDGGPAAAEARQEVEGRMARLAAEVERFARLRLASAVLREVVERCRKEHQGPVLDRASELFAALTVGSFAGVRPDLDEKGQPILLGVRPDGTTLDVAAMSEGTADQLYLALRLASLHAHLDAGHEPMPLVLDDILVNFDDARALAALRALADLSDRTQVLFFTHHAHLVELARSALPEGALFVHHLAYPYASAAVNGHAEAPSAGPAKPKRKKKATPEDGPAGPVARPDKSSRKSEFFS